MSKSKRQKEQKRLSVQKAKTDAAEAREAYRRADAWARSPEGRSYGAVLNALSAEAEK
jgi:hypothetical protein